MKFGIALFPGYSYAKDCLYVIGEVLGEEAVLLPYDSTEKLKCDCFILPGGNSGDGYWSGKEITESPLMREMVNFSNGGGPILAMGSSLHVLTKCGILPGTLNGPRIPRICRTVYLKLESNRSLFTSTFTKNVVSFPIAHDFSSFYADEETLNVIEDRELVLFRYSEIDGRVTAESNLDGSVNNIAGLRNEEGNVAAITPLPIRFVEGVSGNTDGRMLFESLLCQIAG